MGRFSGWSPLSYGLLVLAVVFAIGAVLDAALGHTTPAIISAVLVVAIFWARARAR